MTNIHLWVDFLLKIALNQHRKYARSWKLIVTPRVGSLKQRKKTNQTLSACQMQDRKCARGGYRRHLRTPWNLQMRSWRKSECKLGGRAKGTLWDLLTDTASVRGKDRSICEWDVFISSVCCGASHMSSLGDADAAIECPFYSKLALFGGARWQH